LTGLLISYDGMSAENSFFWLHIKKCGGESFRKTFTPPYVQTERIKNPKPFIATPKSEWNDLLNTFKIPLGEYDFKRMLFAKKFLYSGDVFNRMFKFVIVRNPYDRAVSAWKYLMREEQYHPKYIRMKNSMYEFLSALPEIWDLRYDRHIATHTAPIWPDITDEQGNLLVDAIFKLENIDEEIKILSEKLGVDVEKFEHINKNRDNTEYRSFYDEEAKNLLETLYKEDIQNLHYTF